MNNCDYCTLPAFGCQLENPRFYSNKRHTLCEMHLLIRYGRLERYLLRVLKAKGLVITDV